MVGRNSFIPRVEGPLKVQLSYILEMRLEPIGNQ